jgi:hypothetical protein
MYDIIGDIHGHADRLKALPLRLGYTVSRGAGRHPSNIALFVGDLIDRGAGQILTLTLVRPMREAGSAAVAKGNHERHRVGDQRPCVGVSPSPPGRGAKGGIGRPLRLSVPVLFADLLVRGMPMWSPRAATRPPGRARCSLVFSGLTLFLTVVVGMAILVIGRFRPIVILVLAQLAPTDPRREFLVCHGPGGEGFQKVGIDRQLGPGNGDQAGQVDADELG